jgi:hypothetical protein
MANEFIIREGLSSESSVIITGSLVVTGGITASLATSSYSITSSYSLNSLSASLVSNIPSASFVSFVSSASIATLASNVPSYSTNYTATRLNPNYTTGSTGIGYLSPLYYFFVNSAAAASNRQFNTMYLTPIYINSNCTVTKIGIQCQKNGATNNTVRLGIYTNSNLMLPETNLSDTVISPSTDNVSRFYESTLATPLPLQAGEVYWLASMLCGTGTTFLNAINYRTVDPSLATLPQIPFHRFISPLLGSSIPTNQNAIKNITYYAYTVASTASLQATLPQTPGSYTVYSYGARVTTPASHSNTFIPPAIFVTY